MDNQKEVLDSAYASMTPWAQAKLCKMAVEMARTWPAKKRRGLLTLVAQSSPPNILGRVVNRDVDQLAIVGRREAVDR